MLGPPGQERFVWGFVTAPETCCLLDKKAFKLIWPIAMADCCVDINRKSSQEQNSKPRLQSGLRATGLLNVLLLHVTTRSPMSYGTIHLCFHLGFCRICSLGWRRVWLSLQLISLSSDAWTRREFYISEWDFSNLVPWFWPWIDFHNFLMVCTMLPGHDTVGRPIRIAFNRTAHDSRCRQVGKK